MYFFDSTDSMDIAGRMTGKIRPLAAKRLRSFEFGFALFEAFDTPVSAASQNTNQFSKSSQSIVEFSAVQSIYFRHVSINNKFSWRINDYA